MLPSILATPTWLSDSTILAAQIFLSPHNPITVGSSSSGYPVITGYSDTAANSDTIIHPDYIAHAYCC